MIIYKNYNQEALDKQYNNRAAVPNFAQIVEQWQKNSNTLRQRTDYYQKLKYGPHSREYLDVFPASQTRAPVQVFFHGGYWQALDTTVFHFIAAGFIKYSITTVLINYPLAPQASMDEIVAACRRAMIWLHRHGAEYNGDPDKIYISGHSAGGHIVAMLMATNWPDLDRTLPNDLIKGGCAISGLFNLIPIQRCYLNDVLGMDEELARRNSPVLLSPACNSPLIVTVGSLESDEYHAQSQELIDQWLPEGLALMHMPIANANHFSILEHLVNEGAGLNRAIRKQMHK